MTMPWRIAVQKTVRIVEKQEHTHDTTLSTPIKSFFFLLRALEIIHHGLL